MEPLAAPTFEGARKTDILEIKACADLRIEAAQAQAEKYNSHACTVDELLADEEIELVVNLTIPRAHVEVGVQVLEAGKHVYSEKPLGVDTESGKQLIDTAAEKGRRVGSAPDTFLGAGIQTSRRTLDAGKNRETHRWNSVHVRTRTRKLASKPRLLLRHRRRSNVGYGSLLRDGTREYPGSRQARRRDYHESL